MRWPHGRWMAAIALGVAATASGVVLAQTDATADQTAAAQQTPAAEPAGAGTPAEKASQTQSDAPSIVNAKPPTTDSIMQHCRAAGQAYEAMDEKRDCSDSSSASSQAPVVKKTYTVPAGTKVLLQLRSAINTRSARPGDGVYLVSTFPVVVGNRVMIPAGVYVQGVVDRVTRAGRIKGRAQLDLHFTSMIFPNNTVVEIPGVINSLPGSKDRTVKNQEGTVEENSNKGHDVARAAEIGLSGATIGTLGGEASGHPLEGAAIGGLGGVAVGAVAALFSRGDDIDIESGTPVEMVLQRPLILEDENVAGIAQGGSAPALTPSPNQPRPLGKPHRIRIICPPGGLGCE